MFQGLRNAATTLKMMKILCDSADEHARREGLTELGAEHFLLGAFDLPDGMARRCFLIFGADAESLRAAIEQQYAVALGTSGFSPGSMPPPVAITRKPGAWTLPSSASGRRLLEKLSEEGPTGDPLCGAHVILAALAARQGVVPRALQILSITPTALEAAARAEIDSRFPLP